MGTATMAKGRWGAGFYLTSESLIHEATERAAAGEGRVLPGSKDLPPRWAPGKAKASQHPMAIPPRTPSGQFSRAGMPRDTGTPELSRRLHAMKGKGSPAIQTDKLCAAGLITDEQNEVAALYRELYRRAWGKPEAKIGGYGEMISEGTLRPIVDVDASADPQAKAQRAYMAGRMAVQEACGPAAGVELTRVVIDNADPVARDMDGLRAALDVLRRVYFVGG